MFQLDLKRAEVALAGGRLEEACQLVQQPAVRGHRDGQHLIDALIEALLVRASRHIDSERLDEARHDADLAFALGGRKTEVAETRKQLRSLEQARIEANIAASEPLARQGLEELRSGRLDRATLTSEMLVGAASQSPIAIELHAQLKRCHAISEHLQSGQYVAALRELSLLAQTVPDAEWVSVAKTDLALTIEAINRIQSGPLGLLGSTTTRSAPIGMSELQRHVASMSQLLLQVDGLGVLLLHREPRLSIGSAATSSRFDLPIQTADMKQPLTLSRDGEDYFAESDSSFLVNQRRTQRQLLTSGDRIAVGSRSQLRFVKAVPASGSAVLQFDAAGLARRDIRNVVMLADSLVFAPLGGHFQLPQETASIVVFCQDEALAVRSQAESSQEFMTQPLNVGSSIVIGQTRFSLAHHSLR